MKPKIIVIDPDRKIIKQMKNILNQKYEIVSALSFSEGYQYMCDEPYIIIVDPLFPKKEGVNFIKNLREHNDFPIIAVSENGTERAAVSAIEAGADDFIRKPFFSEEFLARVDLCARRIKVLAAAKGADTKSYYKNGKLTVELDTHTVLVNNNRIHLTKNEFKILALLCRHSGKVVTHDFIIKAVWGPRSYNETGILRVNITNLRKKIEENPLLPQYIQTENGIGYRVGENEA
jgi:two-component system KDP operon response regulator KdpE